MHISDQAQPPRGILTLDFFRAGIHIEHFSEPQLIVDQGRSNVTRLLGGDVANLHIAQIGFGTNGAAALPGNTALTGAFVKSIDGHSYPSATSVLFNFSLAAGEANGLSIIEFGLLTASGLLHARKVRGGAFLKEADLSLSGTWQLLY
ncbi:MAG TPA: hypothetical protein PKZ37_14670 [Gallionellaceae bacterium]|jgi:hypothetical protein|nr:hypothetical protein [Gallionellaceae bacterium]